MNTKHIVGYAATALLSMGAGSAAASDNATPGSTAAPATTVTVTAAPITVPEPPVTVTAPPVTQTVRVTAPAKTVMAAPAPAPAGMDGDGVYQVGVDVAPGTYVSKAADSGNCYWARLSSGSGGFDAIIANGNGSGQVVVTIRKTDKFFESNGCSSWARR